MRLRGRAYFGGMMTIPRKIAAQAVEVKRWHVHKRTIGRGAETMSDCASASTPWKPNLLSVLFAETPYSGAPNRAVAFQSPQCGRDRPFRLLLCSSLGSLSPQRPMPVVRLSMQMLMLLLNPILTISRILQEAQRAQRLPPNKIPDRIYYSSRKNEF